MGEEEFLGGRVRKRSLPLYEEPPGPNAPELKRLMLPQGQLAQICPAGVGMHYIAWVELLEGGVRGNHLHWKKEEWLYLLEGEAELLVEDPQTKERHVLVLVAGDLAVIGTGIAHALRPLRSGQGIEFSPAPFDLGDVERYGLVD